MRDLLLTVGVQVRTQHWHRKIPTSTAKICERLAGEHLSTDVMTVEEVED